MSSKHTVVTNEDIVVSGGKQKAMPRKLYMLGALCLALLLLAGAVLYYRAQKAHRLSEDKADYATVIKESMALRAHNQDDQAIEALQGYAQDSVTPSLKGLAIANIATIYESEQNNAKALQTYRQAEAIAGHDPYIVDIGIARTSYELGDKATAVKYYKLCIPELEKQNKNMMRSDDISSLQNIIKNIEAEQ